MIYLNFEGNIPLGLYKLHYMYIYIIINVFTEAWLGDDSVYICIKGVSEYPSSSSSKNIKPFLVNVQPYDLNHRSFLRKQRLDSFNKPTKCVSFCSQNSARKLGPTAAQRKCNASW